MGEYATYAGHEVKLGTCEDMYYLRADQRHLIGGYSFDAGDRFRFPFPDEDGIEPGQFGDHNRGVEVPGWQLPESFTGHYSVQFTASAGYVLSIPCPEQFAQPGMHVELPDGLRVHRNGFRGYPVVRQQRFFEGRLVTVVACGACGAAWRLETVADAAPVAEAFLDEADRKEYRHDRPGGVVLRHGESHRAFLAAIAARILDGYKVAEPVAS